MGTVRNISYQRLMLAFAVIGVILMIYIYVVDIQIRNKRTSFGGGYLTFVYPNQVIDIDNTAKPNKQYALKWQINSHARDIDTMNVRDDMMVPGPNAWIPFPVKRNPSGPFLIKRMNGEEIKYTNYTFYPLTFNSSFIINNPNICKDTDNLTFLIMVHTAVLHFDQRKALRETWANPRLLKHHSSRILFLLGKPKDTASQNALEIESKQFKDIVQGDFIDDYHNLTHKGILGYRWIVTYCQNAKFIFKIDDDVFVNIFLVIQELLPKYQEGQRIIACRVLTNETIARDGKFAVDPDYFPGYERSPLQYCPGPFVLMLRNLVPEMYESAKRIPFYWVDDFYLFGLLPNELRNMSFHFLENVDNNEENALKCFLGQKPCKYLAAYAWTEGVMYKYWSATLVMYKDLVQKYAKEI